MPGAAVTASRTRHQTELLPQRHSIRDEPRLYDWPVHVAVDADLFEIDAVAAGLQWCHLAVATGRCGFWSHASGMQRGHPLRPESSRCTSRSGIAVRNKKHRLTLDVLRAILRRCARTMTRVVWSEELVGGGVSATAEVLQVRARRPQLVRAQISHA